MLLLALLSCGPRPDTDPGRVTIHRLNRAEYDNTVRDLLGTAQTPAADSFPSDDFGYGFDNVADVLSVSPLHIELYERAADLLIAEALAGDARVWQIEAEGPDVTATTGGATEGGWNVWSNGSVSTRLELPAGTYTFQVMADATQAGDALAQMALQVDEADVLVVDVPGPGVHSAEVTLAAGFHSFGAAFLNDYYEPEAGLDRNLIVDWLRVEGPTNGAASPMLVTCAPSDACAEEIVRDFGARAWRRPLGDDEVASVLALYDLGRDFDEGVAVAAKALLMSPHFTYRVEDEPPPGRSRPMGDYELASRLSYFLWSSMPDEALFARAEAGELQDPEVLAQETRRMLADPKAAAIVDNLAGQWLYLRAIDEANPDTYVFPDWDEPLRASMRASMRSFLADILLEDRSMLELLTADETHVDPRLAQHLGAPEGVVVVPGRTAGLLTQAGLLTALSYPGRTSPVKRGKWVLSNLLCEAPAPPPPGVEGLPADGTNDGLTIREQMERHRADPMCRSCHAAMDPIGFAMEHFDATGAWRDVDETGTPVDASGVLPDGSAFSDVEGLAQVLAASPKVPRCMAQKTFTYALGRAPRVEDLAALQAIEADFAAGGHRFEALATAIVLSDPFRFKTGEAP